MANLNLNKVIIGGKLTADVELKSTPKSISVCSFTVAVARKGKREETEFIPCVAWRSMAEFISKYFRKGSSICLVGNIQTRSWDAPEGKRYKTEVVVEETMFVDNKSDVREDSIPSFDAFPHFDAGNDDDLPY